MVVAVKAEGVRGGLAELSEALFAIDVVSIGRNQQTARLELDAVTRTESESGPFCQERKKMWSHACLLMILNNSIHTVKWSHVFYN